MSHPRISEAVRCHRAGAVTVELSLAMSLLFIGMFAAWDFSRANTILHTIDNAAYEGSRRGIVPGATADDIRDTVTAILDAAYVRNATVAVGPTSLAPTTPNGLGPTTPYGLGRTPPNGLGPTTRNVLAPTTRDVTVTVSVPMNENAWVAPFFLKDRTFTRSYKLTREEYATVSVP